MKSLIAFRSRAGNRYMFDRRTRRLLLCHPLLHAMAELDARGVDVREWTKGPRHLPFECDVQVADFDDSEVFHYVEKWLLLKRSGMFAPVENGRRIGARLRTEDVACALANVKHVCFETTEACNLGCAYCCFGDFYEGFDGRRSGKLDPSVARAVLEHLAERWSSEANVNPGRPIRLSFFGGEPLVNAPFIAEVASFARAHEFLGERVIFSMTTTGTLILGHMDLLVANDFEIMVSLDGDRRNDSYRTFRSGRPSYDVVIKNLEALRSAHPQYFEKNVRFNAVMHDRNSVSEVYRFFKERFGKTPMLSGLSASGVARGREAEFRKMRLDVEKSIADCENREIIERDLYASLPTTRRIMDFVNGQLEFSFGDYPDLVWPAPEPAKLPTGTCPPFAKKLFVTATGKILPCEKIPHHFSLGAATEDGVDLDCGDIAERYNAFYDQMDELCSRCYNADVCGQCLFKQIGSNGARCRGFMSYERFARYLSEIVSDIEERPALYSESLGTRTL